MVERIRVISRGRVAQLGEHLPGQQRVKAKSDSSYSFQFNEMARPGRLELPTLCLEAVRSTLPNLAREVANRADSASWGKFPQPAFSFLHCCLPSFCRRFPRFASHFRDSRVSRPPEPLCRLLSALTCMMAVVRFFGRWFLPNLPNLRTWVRSPAAQRLLLISGCFPKRSPQCQS